MDCFLSKAPIKRSQIISIMSLPPKDVDFADMTPMISSIYEAQILDELETNATDPILRSLPTKAFSLQTHPLQPQPSNPQSDQVWFINPDHVVSQYQGCTECQLVSESHYKHGMGAGFSFESENILKKLETRFALLERCKENENLMQCWSLTKSNFNNCSTRQPLSLLRYSNSRFSLPSPAETVENLSSSALNKGLSLALERKFSKSPCRTPPSRLTASETNLSVPAANFSHLQALSSSGSALSERAFDDSENLSTKGENQNLSRKSRIKRQVSATIDPTQAETNKIEADSIQALQETNVAIQKATSKRLSTLVFQKPVSIHLQTALAELSGKEENYTYQHCLASSVNQQQILDKLSALLIEKSSRSPNARSSLLMGNGKDDMNSKPFPLQSEPEDEVMSGAAVDDFKFDKDQPI
ncbi:hypothetical protein PPACK8108_LOCUS8207 [Phakopsora pachyrhizi]|uniref:Uncharacterized protein n=1 Tax=Phakopsora pachyrhizi TaxID=170000 RepID=A0AAV0AWK0_PHAPC|nr:hypothetical protein PPACK8108_LOCUS8207 [Phakopsora pachyrhizi]